MVGQVAELGKWGVKPASSLTAPTEGLGIDRAIPVLPVLRQVLPQGGLVRGSTVTISGELGAVSLLFASIAELTVRGGWAALVGLPGVGLAAAANMGVALERLALIPSPGPDLLAVAATLLEGFDIVAIGVPGGNVAPAIAAQLSARARKSGSVLIAMSAWPNAALSLAATGSRWLSRGRLRCRELTIEVRGRGGASRPQSHEVWLPDDPEFRAEAAERDAATVQPGTGGVRHLRAVS